MFHDCTYGVLRSGFIVEIALPENVKSDRLNDDLYESGNETYGGNALWSANPPGVKPGAPGWRSRLCCCPGLLPGLDMKKFVPSS